MGTRLYPNTTDGRKLEELANVLPGTTKLLEAKNRLYPVYAEQNKDNDELDFDWHCLFVGSDVSKLEGFHTFGWGKFDLDLIPEDEDKYGGSTTDLHVMYEMLLSSNFRPDEYKHLLPEEIVELSEGFHWV